MSARRSSRLGRVALGVLIAGIAAAPSFAATTAPPATVTRVVHKKVAASGPFVVVIRLAAVKSAETVSVIAGAQRQASVALSTTSTTTLAFTPTVARGARAITVRVKSTGAAVKFTVSAARRPGSGDPAHGSTGASGATGASGTTGVTGVTGATGPTGVTGTTDTVGPTLASGATGTAGVAGGVTVAGPSAGPYKHLVWSDEFNGPAGTPPNPGNWSFDGASGCGPGTLSTNTSSPANASLDGSGDLAITALRTPDGAYTAALLDSKGHFSFSYGRIEARIELPAGSGLCPALYMVGDSASPYCFPGCGEIDVIEAISPHPGYAFATLHGPISGVANYQQWEHYVMSATSLFGSFYDYALTWSRSKIVWTIDGVPYATATPKSLPPSAQWVFNGRAFHVLTDLAVGGWPGAPASGAQFPATMRIDWIRVYN
jgi:beta-glucanase (GH16 family)